MHWKILKCRSFFCDCFASKNLATICILVWRYYTKSPLKSKLRAHLLAWHRNITLWSRPASVSRKRPASGWTVSRMISRQRNSESYDILQCPRDLCSTPMPTCCPSLLNVYGRYRPFSQHVLSKPKVCRICPSNNVENKMIRCEKKTVSKCVGSGVVVDDFTVTQ